MYNNDEVNRKIYKLQSNISVYGLDYVMNANEIIRFFTILVCFSSKYNVYNNDKKHC